MKKVVLRYIVSGKNVYVAGYEWNATLWVNGVAQKLTDGSSANSVYVSGNDVYVVGDYYYDEVYSEAKLWKNGVEQNLSKNVGTYKMEYTTSVFVSDSDVYVTGYDLDFDQGVYDSNQKGFAKLWKNNVVQNLSNGTRHAEANSVFVVE